MEIDGTELGPPPTVKELAARAVEFDYNHLIPLRYWLRTADTLLKESHIYLSEGNDQQAYLLLLRYVELVLKYLPDHPDARIPDNSRRLRELRGRAGEALQRLEDLKPAIQARHDSYLEAQRALEQQYRAKSASEVGMPSQARASTKRVPKPLDLTRRMSSTSLTGPFSPPLGKTMSPLSEESRMDSQTLALEIARQEFEKRERQKRERRMQLARQEGRNVLLDSTGTEIKRIRTPRTQSPARPSWHNDEERRRREAEEEQTELMNSISALNMHAGLEPQQHTGRRSRPQSQEITPLKASDFDLSTFPEPFRESRMPEERHVGSWQGSYPTIPGRSRTPPPSSPYLPYDTPAPPPKYPATAPPAPPQKILLQPNHLPPKPPKTSIPANKPLKPFSTPARLENGTSLRTIFLPSTLRHEFLAIAQPNTVRNLETCGVLCGKLANNAFFIQRLVIPEQDATSDSCSMKDEEGLFTYCDTEELMPLGWIHTHPTQSCFMSSIDVHTHAGYQWQLRESIAIVCAPSQKPDWGVFRLTDPPGVQIVSSCSRKGFHYHPETDIYTDALRPGHVSELPNMGFDVVDLRKG